MRCNMPLLLGCCLVASAAVPARARLIPGLNLWALCDQADVIVVGRVVDVRPGGPTTVEGYAGRLMVAQLTVDKVLKGPTKSGSVNFSFSVLAVPVVSAGYPGIGPGQYGVFFLRRAESGYGVSDPYHPFVVAFPGAPQTFGSLSDQVIGEVGHVLASRQASIDAKQKAMWMLQSVRTPAATAALKTASRDPDAAVRLLAIALLLARNDISELATAEEFLIHPPHDLDQNLMDGLAYAIRDGVKDPHAIPNLTRLLRYGNVTVRRGAVSALRNIGGKEAIGPLTQALGDSDDEVVWTAILGLALTTGDLHHGPGAQEEFKGEQKETYVNYWRNWAKSQR